MPSSLPSALENEAGLIGSLLLAPDLIGEATRVAEPHSISDPELRLIYFAMIDMHAAGEPVDAVTVGQRLQATGKLQAAGGFENLGRLVDPLPSGARAIGFAKKVAFAAKRRGVLTIVDGIARAANDPGTSPETLDERLNEAAEAIHQANDVEKPDEPEPDPLRYVPFPVEVLPEPWRRFVVSGSEAIGCDPSYLALPAIVACASAIGNSTRLRIKRGWVVPSILWGAIVGESGNQKSPPFRLARRPLSDRQSRAIERHNEAMRNFEVERLRHERDLAEWKRKRGDGDGDPPEKPEPPTAEKCVVSDVTIEALASILQANPRGLLLACDELAGWSGSFDRYSGGKGADVAAWLSVFNAETIHVERKTGDQRTINVPSACVSVCGGIQPGTLRRVLGIENRENGLAARLLLAWPPRRVRRWTEAEVEPEIEAEYGRLIEGLFQLQLDVGPDGRPRPVMIEMTPEAKAAWVDHFNRHAGEQADLSGDMAAAWSKLEETPARLALVIHLVRLVAGDPTLQKPDRVDAASMKAAIALAEWFKNEARRVYAMLDESDAGRDQRRLVEWIKRRGGEVTAREVQRGCRWLNAPGSADEALANLVKAGRGLWRSKPATAKGGRPARVFVLSTLSTVDTTPELPEENGSSVDTDTVDEPEQEPNPPAEPDRPGESDEPAGAVDTTHLEREKFEVSSTVDTVDAPKHEPDEDINRLLDEAACEVTEWTA